MEATVLTLIKLYGSSLIGCRVRTFLVSRGVVAEGVIAEIIGFGAVRVTHSSYWLGAGPDAVIELLDVPLLPHQVRYLILCAGWAISREVSRRESG